MTLLQMLHCRVQGRHTWQTRNLYHKALDANLCAYCGAPETPTDAKKLEIQQILITEFGPPPSSAPYGPVCQRASDLLKQYFAKQRGINLSAS